MILCVPAVTWPIAIGGAGNDLLHPRHFTSREGIHFPDFDQQLSLDDFRKCFWIGWALVLLREPIAGDDL